MASQDKDKDKDKQRGALNQSSQAQSRMLGTRQSTDTLKPITDNNQQEHNDDEQPQEEQASQQNDGRRWSIWGRSRPLDIDSKNPPTQPSNQDRLSTSPAKSEQSLTCNPPISRDSNKEATSVFSEDSKGIESSWLGWRKPSLTSLRLAAAVNSSNPNAANGSSASRSTSPKKEFEEELNKSPEHLKAVEIDPSSKVRSSSWSFWSPQNVTESITNKILNGITEDIPDAMLFESSTVSNDESSSKKKPQIKSKNQVVPGFEQSLPLHTMQSSFVNNINRLRYTLGFEVKDPKHLYRTDQLNHKNIKKIMIIGVHGFFPTKVIRPLIGEPTGTSIKFANEAEKAIKRFIQKEGLKNVEIQKIALEKDGKIFNRVDFFFKILSKWIDELNSSDYIYIAAHSQGCPVSILLLSKLITSGTLNFDNNKKICILAMAGVNNGPFYGIDQRLFVRAYSTIESDSLMELFDFQKFDSVISVEFLKALKVVISQNQIKLVFVGSINDQLVPLYSSNCLHIRHPNIFRATYVDGGSNTPHFVTRVVSIANQLHNLGFSDHGVIKEVSNALAGPLTGGGHSKIYHDSQVYDLALSFSLKTNDLKYQVPLHFKPFSIQVLGNNPYHLPWCMRGLLFESKDKLNSPEVDEEIVKLFEEFENWKPETKQLKDMKYRLNGLKSKL